MKAPRKRKSTGTRRGRTPAVEALDTGPTPMDTGRIELIQDAQVGGDLPDSGQTLADLPDVEVELPPELADPIVTEDGGMLSPMDGGGLEVDFSPAAIGPDGQEHNANLAEVLSDFELQQISDDLLDGIEADDQTRQQWLADRAKGIELLGLRIDDPRTGDTGSGVANQSVVRHPLLADAVFRFQANARSELLPASGPVKVVNDGIETTETDDQADRLEDALNHYLVNVATEYYPDTTRMLLEVGFSGVAFKKVYTCPRRRRPVSEMISGKDLIVSNNVTDLANAGRITHRTLMRPSVLKRMQYLGVYRKVELGDVEQPELDVADQKVQSVQGFSQLQRPEDLEREIDECYCELDLPGFEHKDEMGEPTGLPLPYRVTIDRQSKQVLEIRRNWREGDPDHNRQINIVKFPYIEGLGFYSIGLYHILGNATAAATATWRQLLDAGAFANFPGFLVTKAMAQRQKSNNFRVGPGEGVQIDTGGEDIRSAVMPLPYKEPSQTLMALHENIVGTAGRVAGSADQAVGEGKQDAPVGTTLALLEGQTKVMSAVHKNLHTAQKREFELFAEEFKKDPEALWRNNRKAARYFDIPTLMAALENVALVPHSDPNVPSTMHRMAKMQALFQIAQAAPMLFNLMEVAREMIQEIGYGDPDRFFAPPAPPQPDPMAMAMQMEAQNKQAMTQIKGAELQLKAQKQQFDMATAKEKMDLERDKAVIELAQTMARYPESDRVVDTQLIQMSPFLSTPMGVAQARSLQLPRTVNRRRPTARRNGFGGQPQLPGLGMI